MTDTTFAAPSRRNVVDTICGGIAAPAMLSVGGVALAQAQT